MSQSAGKKKKYPINRPKTTFSMKANLVQREPAFQKRWEKIDLYRRCREADHPAGPFIFHDGPPYANGDIHMGHLLNKVLKDLVVRSKTMAGFDVDFVPGWDCHGLPIEHKVLKEQADQATAPGAAAEVDTGRIMHIRRKCRSYAEKYVKLQARQMQRLGTTGDYDHPYITMDPDYEAGVLEVFADLVGKELVYRQLKPVHWSIANQTALAEAELEYYDREDTSVYVLFEISNPPQEFRNAMGPVGVPNDAALHMLIWTTTPWTLPANMAVAVAEKARYGLYEVNLHGTKKYIFMAEGLAEGVFAAAGVSNYHICGGVLGREFDIYRVAYRHPFVDDGRPRGVYLADYVTLEDGTGLVHTAPGHGVEDWQTGLREKLDIYCPVQADGTFDDTAPDWLRGRIVWEANGLVVEHLRESGHLFHDHLFTHSYPHDWRSKTPVIFRATEQWFINVDRAFAVSAGPQGRADQDAQERSLRERALAATADQTAFLPEWGRNRMRGMLESRPDWCISRQRAWGLPIPAFQHTQTGQVLLTQKSVEAVAANIRKHGSDYWFTASPGELLAGYDVQADPDAPAGFKGGSFDPATLHKSADIFDVWFESGSSWHACMEQRGLKRKSGPVTDLYLEGSDQHRGWFQLSLLPCLGMRGVSPFKTVLTHGFMVDAHGQKMSKSGGNAIAVEDLLKEHGADVCRWWVAGLNCANDVKVDWSFFGIAADEYRKVRNTIRFALSNLNDFDPSTDRRPLSPDDRYSIDAFAHGQLAEVVRTVQHSYEKLDFRRAAHVLFDFCNETLSAVYLAAVKDRLYCDKPDSDRRRRTQTVLYEIADRLIRMVAPILVHTADEAWLALQGHNPDQAHSDDSVHLQRLPEAMDSYADEHWPQVMALRDRALKALEDARAQRGLDNPLDAGIEAAVPGEVYQWLKPFEPELADLCGVSRFVLDEDGAETIGVEDLTHQRRCARSWKRDGTVSQYTDADGDAVDLTRRDAEALGLV